MLWPWAVLVPQSSVGLGEDREIRAALAFLSEAHYNCWCPHSGEANSATWLSLSLLYLQADISTRRLSHPTTMLISYLIVSPNWSVASTLSRNHYGYKNVANRDDTVRRLEKRKSYKGTGQSSRSITVENPTLMGPRSHFSPTFIGLAISGSKSQASAP